MRTNVYGRDLPRAVILIAIAPFYPDAARIVQSAASNFPLVMLYQPKAPGVKEGRVQRSRKLPLAATRFGSKPAAAAVLCLPLDNDTILAKIMS